MKRMKFGAVVAALCALAAAMFAGCASSEADSIRTRWGVNLPRGLQTIYHEDSFGWFGDGYSYTVFTGKGEQMTTERFTAFCLGELEGFSVKTDGAYCARLEEEASATVCRLNVPEEYAPDFSGEYWYSLGEYEPQEYGDVAVDGVLFVWFEEKSLLAVFEGRS